ncbi:hypothetical protein [Pelagicoccus albus]|uniref:Uncharacterized protein n=1 Tax=Pelagicoccus albus TaxID=415222 RepID=A0A7X1B712_9BACT|nr:hypothetical protein [Pelagicoccus albus]MBC2606579.1 hypothetical protein [Pelagicoccus albus]
MPLPSRLASLSFDDEVYRYLYAGLQLRPQKDQIEERFLVRWIKLCAYLCAPPFRYKPK